MLNRESDGSLATARERDGDTVLNRFFHARDAFDAERFVARRVNDRAEIVRQAHSGNSLECAVSRAAISDLQLIPMRPASNDTNRVEELIAVYARRLNHLRPGHSL